MNIWILKASEPTIYDEKYHSQRLFRYGYLSKELIKREHEVTWFTDSFDHFQKKHRFQKDHIYQEKGLKVYYLYTPGYRSNVSIRRFRDHKILARKIYEIGKSIERPDVIVSGYPSDSICAAGIALGEFHNSKVIIDVRDLWPDVFFNRVSLILRPFLWIFTLRMKARRKYIFSNADAIIGNTDEFVEWGLNWKKGNKKHPILSSFPITKPNKMNEIIDSEVQEKYWNDYKVSNDNGKIKVIFFGAYSSMYNLPDIIEAARIMEEKGHYNYQFILAGRGPDKKYLAKISSGIESVILCGWIDAPKISYLLSISHFGLSPYVDEPNFTLNFTNKPGEYLGASLPILSSISGHIGKLLMKHRCGKVYANPQELVSILLEYEGDPAKYEVCRNNALAFYNNHLNSETVFNRMSIFIENVINK